MATYSCNPGYELNGAFMRICEVVEGEASGVFSGVAPTCDRKFY